MALPYNVQIVILKPGFVVGGSVPNLAYYYEASNNFGGAESVPVPVLNRVFTSEFFGSGGTLQTSFLFESCEIGTK